LKHSRTLTSQTSQHRNHPCCEHGGKIDGWEPYLGETSSCLVLWILVFQNQARMVQASHIV